MPTYEYRCKSCERELEVVQAFTDDALTTCDECGGPLRKVFGSVGISFKGSGFYKNDSRGSSGSTSSGGDGSSSDTTPSTTPAATPAAEKSSGSDTKTSDKPAKKSGEGGKTAAAAAST